MDWVQRHEWVEGAKLTASHEALLQRYSVVSVVGKGDALLSVFFPHNCTAALDMLADSNVREKAVGVQHEQIPLRILRAIAGWVDRLQRDPESL